jgi:threonine dehydrogenase-like Zn-dependent dehydrogenase
MQNNMSEKCMIPRIKIGIVGTGYVGIVTGCCLASLGFSVWCMDAESAKVDMLNNGQLPIYEPELEDIFIAERQSGRLRFVHTLPELLDVDVIFITVGTLEQDSQGGRTGALGNIPLQYPHNLFPQFLFLYEVSYTFPTYCFASPLQIQNVNVECHNLTNTDKQENHAIFIRLS